MVRTSNKNEKNNATIDCTQTESAKLGGGNKVREWDTNLCRDGALYKFTSTLFYYTRELAQPQKVTGRDMAMCES